MTNDSDVSPEKLAKIMERVALLLARADHPNTPPAEADLSRERAERLMAQYRIDEANLSEDDRSRMGIMPTYREWWVAPMSSEFKEQYKRLAHYIALHVDGLVVSGYGRPSIEVDPDQNLWHQYTVFGYESDLAYADLLWSSARLGFAAALEPRYDPSLSDGDNVFAMRSAGMERNRIARIMGWEEGVTLGTAHGRVAKVFKAECARRGVDPSSLTGRGNNVKHYRESYANAFTERIWDRLWHMRTRAGLNSRTVAMADRTDRIREAMYAKFPQLRPDPNRVREPYVDPRSEAQKRRDEARERREAVRRAARYHAGGDAAGSRAADSVNLTSSGTERLG